MILVHLKKGKKSDFYQSFHYHKYLTILSHLFFPMIWRISLGQTLLHIKNTCKLYKTPTSKSTLQSLSPGLWGWDLASVIFTSPQVTPVCRQVWEPGFQDSLSSFLQWYWHPKGKTILPKGTQPVDGKTVMQTQVYLSPKAMHNLSHGVTFSPEVR